MSPLTTAGTRSPWSSSAKSSVSNSAVKASRLKALLTEDFSLIEVDYNIVTSALEQWAHNAIKNLHESVDIAALNTSQLRRLRHASAAEWAEAVRDAEARFEDAS